MMDKNYTRKEAADRLRVIPETVSEWIKAGKLPGSRKIGKKWLIPASAVEGRAA